MHGTTSRGAVSLAMNHFKSLQTEHSYPFDSAITLSTRLEYSCIPLDRAARCIGTSACHWCSVNSERGLKSIVSTTSPLESMTLTVFGLLEICERVTAVAAGDTLDAYALSNVSNASFTIFQLPIF